MELKSYLLTAQALGLRGVLVSLGRTVCRQAAHLLDDLRGREPSAQAPKCFWPTLNSQREAGAPRGQERVGTGEGEDARFPQDTEPPHSQHLAHMRPGDHAGQAAMGGEGGRVAQALSPAGPHVSGGWTRLGAGFYNQAPPPCGPGLGPRRSTRSSTPCPQPGSGGDAHRVTARVATNITNMLPSQSPWEPWT